jgi:hypothetical protein
MRAGLVLGIRQGGSSMSRTVCAIIAAGMLLYAASALAQSQDGSGDFPRSATDDVSYSGLISAADEKTNRDPQNTCACNCCDQGGWADCCCVNCDCFDDCDPLWTIKAGAVIIERARPHSAVIATVPGSSINARDFTFNWQSGPDVSLIRSIGGGYDAIEIRFFGANAWTDTESFNGPYLLTTNPPSFLLNPTITYTSRLYSTEINWRERAADWLTWMAGFRWLQVSENLDASPIGGGDLVFNTNNNLYGAQMGADVHLWDRGGLFRVESAFKAGVYGNSADNAFHSISSTDILLAADRYGQTAFVVEIDVTGVCQLTDHIALRGGYQLLWIDGLALAGDQVGVTTVPLGGVGSGIDASGDAFYQGVLASIDFIW